MIFADADTNPNSSPATQPAIEYWARTTVLTLPKRSGIKIDGITTFAGLWDTKNANSLYVTNSNLLNMYHYHDILHHYPGKKTNYNLS
jgi:hypothetical protein